MNQMIENLDRIVVFASEMEDFELANELSKIADKLTKVN